MSIVQRDFAKFYAIQKYKDIIGIQICFNNIELITMLTQ